MCTPVQEHHGEPGVLLGQGVQQRHFPCSGEAPRLQLDASKTIRQTAAVAGTAT